MPQSVAPLIKDSDADQPVTLVDVFERVARRHKRKDTLNYKSEGRWVSVSSDEMMARAREIAAGLYAIGVRRGDRVAILSDSRVEWTLTDAGCIFAGVVDVPIYPTLTPPQVKYILNDSGAGVLFVANREKYEELRDVIAESPVKLVVAFESTAADDVLSLVQLEAKGVALLKDQPGLIDRVSREIASDDLATIIYTSGTTGEPKGVMLSHS